MAWTWNGDSAGTSVLSAPVSDISSGPWTFAAKVYARSTGEGGQGYIIAHSTGTPVGVQRMVINNGSALGDFALKQTYATAGEQNSGFTTGRWNLLNRWLWICGVFDDSAAAGSRIKMWVGDEQNSPIDITGSVTAAVGGRTTGGTTAIIGNQGTNAARTWDGYIEDAIADTTAWSAAQVLAFWQGWLPHGVSTLRYWLPLTEPCDSPTQVPISVGGLTWTAAAMAAGPRAPIAMRRKIFSMYAAVAGGAQALAAAPAVGVGFTADLIVSHPAAATVAVQTAMTADVAVARPLAATAAVQTAATADTIVAHSLAATAAVQTAATADVVVAHSLAATTAVQTAVTAALNVAHPLAATSAVVFGVTADLTDTPAGTNLAATIAVQTAVTAALTAAHPLAATAAVQTGATADVVVAHPLVATAAVTTAATAAVTVAHPLAGTFGIQTGVTADVRVSHPLAAAIAVLVALSADLTRSGPVSLLHASWHFGDPAFRWDVDELEESTRWNMEAPAFKTGWTLGPMTPRWDAGDPTRKEPS